MLRMAARLQGLLRRALAGTATSYQAHEAGRRARPLAELAWKEVERSRAGSARRLTPDTRTPKG
jgi:hypothetical protein